MNESNSPDHLVELVRRLRTRYTECRRLIKPEYVMNTARWHDEFWVSVAKIVFDLGASPESFVDLAFSLFRGGPPMPNFLKAPRLVTAYDLKRKHYDTDEAQLALRMMTSLFESHLAAGRTLQAVISDEQLYFNDLFRYCMAVRFGLTSLAEVYKPAASKFLLSFPAYRELMVKLLPEGTHASI